MFNKRDFLKGLKERREEMGISKEEMARRMNTSVAEISRIESGNSSLRLLAKYLDVLKLDLNKVFIE